MLKVTKKRDEFAKLVKKLNIIYKIAQKETENCKST